MLLGRERFRDAFEELARILHEELAGFGLPSEPDDIARVLGIAPEELDRRLLADDRWGVEDAIARWDRFAQPRGLSRLVLVDHGDEAEILLGHPMRPRHRRAM